MTRRRTIVAVAVLASLLAACGDSRPEDVVTKTDAGAAMASPDSPAASPTAARPVPSAESPFPAGEPVDLVVLAASGGAGVAERYAPLLAEGLGREVRNGGHLGARPAAVMSGVEEGAAAVAGAEVILFYFPPAGYEPPEFLTCLEVLDAVTDPDYPGGTLAPGQTWDPPLEATTVEDWQAWRDALDREYEAMWKLREGQPTIIRGYGGWNPWIPVWREAGVEDACTAGEEALDQVQREAAEAHGAVYVSMLDVFTGSTHDQDPGEQGWIAEDGMHLSEAGKDYLVEALAAAGWTWSEPPR